MAIVAHSTVGDRPWGRTFAAIAARRFDGSLAIRAEGRTYQVGWRGGAVVSADNSLPADAIARVALTTQLVTSSQVSEIVRVLAGAPGRDEVEVIAEVAHLTPDLVGRLRRRTVAVRAMRTFALTAGDVILDDTPPPASEVAIDARAITYAGVKAHYAEARLLGELAAFGVAFQLRAEALPELAQFGFGDAERPALTVLRRGLLSPHELEEACPEVEPRIVRAILYALASFGAVDITTSVSTTGSNPRLNRPTPRTQPATTPPPVRPRVPTTSPPPRAQPTTIAPPPAQATTIAPPRAQATTIAPPRAQATTIAPPRAQATTIAPPPVAPRAASPTPPPPTRPAAALVLHRDSSGPNLRVRPIDDADGAARARPDAEAVRALITERVALLDGGADHFALIGVTIDAAAAEVRDAYFALARQLHPDRLAASGVRDQSRDAQRLFAQINAAFGVLSNPKKRAEYVAMLQSGGEEAAAAEQAQAEALASKLLGAEEHFRRGEMALRRDQLDRALVEFQEAVALNPAEGEHHALLGWVTFALAPDKAVVRAPAKAMLDKAVELAPRSPTPHLYLGRIARLEGRDADAMAAFQKALAIAPGHTEAASELRVLEARRGAKPDDPRGGGLFGFRKKP
jgi:Flp pilus assembly protein TadD